MDKENSETGRDKIEKINQIIKFSSIFFIGVLGVFVIFGGGSIYDEYYLLKEILSFFIDNQQGIDDLKEVIHWIITFLFIISFVLTIYFLNLKEKVKKKYNLNGKDSLEIDVEKLNTKLKTGERKGQKYIKGVPIELIYIIIALPLILLVIVVFNLLFT